MVISGSVKAHKKNTTESESLRKYLIDFAASRSLRYQKKEAKSKKSTTVFSQSRQRRSEQLVSLLKYLWLLKYSATFSYKNLLPSLLKQLKTRIRIRVRVPKILRNLLIHIFRPYALTFRFYPKQTGIVITILATLFAGAFFVHEYIFRDLPDAQLLTTTQPALTTRILDRNGEVLYRIYKDENRTPIALSEIPDTLINATIAIEDQEFYLHHGFSLRGILRAIIANKNGEVVQGGSTITQQLVKNRLLSPQQTLQRKVRELVLAVMVEQTYNKQEILEMYLNQVAYGGSTYGIEEAAQRYFGKSAKELNLAESSLLAGLPAAPSSYSPFGPNPDLAKMRQQEVLRRMVEENMISSDEAIAAYQAPLALQADVVDIQAPHFVMYVKQLLAEKYSEEILQNGGLEVTTTLDLPLQNTAQQIVTDEITSLARLHIQNGAALVTQPMTGEILAMVGSTDYFDIAHDGQVNVTLRPRQPGSSIKPLTYSLALTQGFTPATIITDAPVVFDIAGSKPYAPKNYDGKSHGQVTLRESLASSYNIPAVKVLAQLGVSNLLDYAEKLGITTWKARERFGLSLTLGGGEVLMTEMAQVYGVFASGGNLTPLNPILKITDHSGKVLYENTCALSGKNCPKNQVLDPRSAYQITSILSDNVARTPAFGSFSSLNISKQEVAVKTGTTNSLRDNWTIGYTSDRVVSVWVGNNDNTPMSYVASGITGASPIWNKIIRTQLTDESPHVFPVPYGLIKVPVCKQTGTLTCLGCPTTYNEVFIAGTEPKNTCGNWKPNTSPSPSGKPQIL
ncbi:MAG: PBP1A family penicillin-binding protein [Candidatus Pacebacteria bacterium]|nr:PBP1A family penicillin-binding protein [Candidatus Paceibacterota bacterium]